jgi:hypothetical protein
MGGKHDCAVAKPQVTDPGPRRVKIVRMFEFMSLNSASDWFGAEVPWVLRLTASMPPAADRLAAAD